MTCASRSKMSSSVLGCGMLTTLTRRPRGPRPSHAPTIEDAFGEMGQAGAWDSNPRDREDFFEEYHRAR
jgi:hypothetical protein